MAKLTLTDLSSLTNETSAITTINANNTLIEEAFEITLSRNGLSPNVMSDDLDMNSFRILNTPAPVDDNDLVRLIDVAEGIRGEKGDTGDPGGPLADGDYGDIVVSNNGADINLETSLSDSIQDSADVIATLGNSATRNVGTTSGTVAVGDDTRFYRYTITIKDSAYTITAANATTPTIIFHTSGSAHSYTIDPIVSTAYPDGSQVTIVNGTTAGVITLLRGAGVAFYANGGTSSADVSIAAGGICTAIHLGSNVWYVTGSGLS